MFVWRCTWHRSPLIDLSLLKIRTFSAANSMTLVGAAGFYGYTLTNVLFLTGVWRYSVLQAGLALTHRARSSPSPSPGRRAVSRSASGIGPCSSPVVMIWSGAADVVRRAGRPDARTSWPNGSPAW